MIFIGVETLVFVIETLFVLQHQCSVDVQAKVIRHDLVKSDLLILPPSHEPEACQKDVRGEGMLIYRLIYGIKEQLLCSRDIYADSTRFNKLLRQTVARECNGKHRCILSDSIKVAIPVHCNDHLQIANEIRLSYECKPIIFSITPELSANVVSREFNTTYLVLDLPQTRPTEIHCKINGKYKELKFTLLHVDFGPNLNCHRSDTTCHGHINITDDKMKTTNYTYNWLPIETFHEYLKFVSFDVSMTTGLLWIQLEGYTEIQIECVDTAQIARRKRRTLSITSTTVFQTSEAKTMVEHGPTRNTKKTEVDDTVVELDGTSIVVDGTKLELDGITIEVDGTAVELDGTSIEVDGTKLELDGITIEVDAHNCKEDLLLKIVISLSVALLASLTAVCATVTRVFWRRQSKCNHDYDVPTMRQPDIKTYCVPIGSSAKDTHGIQREDDLEMTRMDDGYVGPAVVFHKTEQAVLYEEINR